MLYADSGGDAPSHRQPVAIFLPERFSRNTPAILMGWHGPGAARRTGNPNGPVPRTGGGAYCVSGSDMDAKGLTNSPKAGCGPVVGAMIGCLRVLVHVNEIRGGGSGYGTSPEFDSLHGCWEEVVAASARRLRNGRAIGCRRNRRVPRTTSASRSHERLRDRAHRPALSKLRLSGRRQCRYFDQCGPGRQNADDDGRGSHSRRRR